jgi:hypothetical protein
MLELRGYDNYPYDENGKDLTKISWKEYCDRKGYAHNYNLGKIFCNLNRTMSVYININ